MGASAHTKVEQVTERGAGAEGADDILPRELLAELGGPPDGIRPDQSHKERRRVRLARLVARLERDPDGDPDRFLDAVEASVGASASAFTQAELDGFAQAGIDVRGSATDPRGTVALYRGLVRQDLDARTALTVAAAAKHLGVSASRVRQLIGANSLFAVRAQDERRLPAWQFTTNGYVPGIASFAEAARELHPLALAQFMSRPNVDLLIDDEAVTPVAWLSSGGSVEEVAGLVAGLTY